MKKTNLFIAAILAASLSANSQHTFSICAIDTVTGEIGSAGASCIDDIGCGGCGGVIIISDVRPGVGVIHTQAYYTAANQNYAKSLMNSGLSPKQILDSLKIHDSGNDSTIRQYGIVDLFSGSPRVAAYTGINCMNYKNHITGPNYSIQGNILLGQQILDSMEAGFLNTQGDMACKLMAALQGAKVPGADTRCTTSGNSSLSSFLRVAKTTDISPNYYLNLSVKSGPAGFEPIDSLQTLFNAAHALCSTIGIEEKKENSISVIPNPAQDNVRFVFSYKEQKIYLLEIYNVTGQKVIKKLLTHKETEIDISEWHSGIYFYKIILEENKTISGKFIKE